MFSITKYEFFVLQYDIIGIQNCIYITYSHCLYCAVYQNIDSKQMKYKCIAVHAHKVHLDILYAAFEKKKI